MSQDVQICRSGAAGHISLARPKALHALTREMCERVAAALLEWREDESIKLVILDHLDGRGFCAGGDVAMVRRSVLDDDGEAGRAFFRAEYRLNHLLFTYSKPTAVFMDGVTMGGGVGLALPCQYRIATENTLFAMPEGAIGLFPDVGAGWYLPRLEGRIGPFLALTGARLDGAECLWAELATHYLTSDRLVEAKTRIVDDPDRIEDILHSLQVEPPPARLARNAEKIDRLFASDRLEDILAALADDPSEWAAKELRAVATKCPTSAKVALRQFAESHDDFTQEMALEYRLACRMIARPDFAEGVRAVLVDKDNAARWNPGTAAEVSEAELDAIFAPFGTNKEWTPYPA